MSAILVKLQTGPQQGQARAVTVPVAIPDLDDVRKFAQHLHENAEPYHDRAWGWEVTYEPEVCEAAAEVEVPDDQGNFETQVMALWMPASFTIGESGVWFFSMLWENGVDQPAVEFLDDRSVVETA